MKRKEMYTLQELYEELEIPLSTLGRKCDISEGTAARIRDGFPARRPTINKLLRAFSEIYGIDFSLDNVSGIQIENKKASTVSKKPPISSATTTQEKEPQISIVEPKRAYIRRKESGLPDGCILASKFAESHGVARPTFIDHMNIGLGKGLIHGPDVPEDGSVLVKDWVRYEERPKRVRKDGTVEKERFLTLSQQADAIAFWKRHDVSFSQCDQTDCPCH
jgi:hypothetical protein